MVSRIYDWAYIWTQQKCCVHCLHIENYAKKRAVELNSLSV